MKAQTLLVGVGNPLRRDDGVGPELVRRLGEMALADTEAVGDVRETSGLVEFFQDRGAVFLFDAVFSGAPAGTFHRIEAHARPLGKDIFRCSTHHFSVSMAVELARSLGLLPPKLVLYGIEGKDFGLGPGLSEPVRSALDDFLPRIASEIRRVSAGGSDHA